MRTNPAAQLQSNAGPRSSGKVRKDLHRKGLEVNVIFTDERATAAALKAAGALALDLGACIRVRAAIAVPSALPLDGPRFPFLYGASYCLTWWARWSSTPRIHNSLVFVSRPARDTFSSVAAEFVVVMGGRKRLASAAESRMAKALRSQGHRVVFIDAKKGTRMGSAKVTKKPNSHARIRWRRAVVELVSARGIAESSAVMARQRGRRIWTMYWLCSEPRSSWQGASRRSLSLELPGTKTIPVISSAERRSTRYQSQKVAGFRFGPQLCTHLFLRQSVFACWKLTVTAASFLSR